MSVRNGVWHDAQLDPPAGELVCKTVLIVKANKSGKRVICFGAWMSDGTGLGGRWTPNNGLGSVLYWMPLPKIPEN